MENIIYYWMDVTIKMVDYKYEFLHNKFPFLVDFYYKIKDMFLDNKSYCGRYKLSYRKAASFILIYLRKILF